MSAAKPISNMKPKFIVLLVVICCGILLVSSRFRLEHARAARMEQTAAGEPDIYLPEVSYLKFISLGHDGLVSDLVLARALTYFGSHYRQRHTFRFKHQEKLFLTALHMDPRNRDAFMMANNIMCTIDVKAGINILKLGMEHHPDFWKFPEMIGFDYFYYLEDYHSAAKYYEISARLPGHPPYVPSLAGKFYRRSGHGQDALRVLNNFYTTTRDKRLKESFKASMEEIAAQINRRRFFMRGRVTALHGPLTLEIEPRRDNPMFAHLAPVEPLRIVGVRPFSGALFHSPSLVSFFQTQYARLLLLDKTVEVMLVRLKDGRIRRDRRGRMLGTLQLNSGKSYGEVAVHEGILVPHYGFPFSPLQRSVMERAQAEALEAGAGLHVYPPPEVPLKKVTDYVGRMITIRFTVHRVDTEEKKYYLRTNPDYLNRISVVVPTSLFTAQQLNALTGQTVIVSGLVTLRDRALLLELHTPRQLQAKM